MADSVAFGRLCEFLESSTSFDRLEARGTVRLSLKQAGLEARGVTAEQLIVVVDRLLSAELSARGIENPDGVCEGAIAELRALDSEATATDSPEAVFRRMGGD